MTPGLSYDDLFALMQGVADAEVQRRVVSALKAAEAGRDYWRSRCESEREASALAWQVIAADDLPRAMRRWAEGRAHTR